MLYLDKTAQVTPQDNVARTIEVAGSTYTFQQLHFHWGSRYDQGSEHTLDDVRYALERNMKIFLFFPFLPLIISGQFFFTRKHKERYCAREDQRSWSYHGYTNGPANWPRLFPTCAGDKQSPVDIRTNKVTVDAELSDLRFVGYDTPVTNALVTNNGGTIRITFEDQVRRFISVDNKEYDLQQFHFHWGTAKNPGAEHAINGFKNTVEIHFVHSNGNSTAVVGTLYEVDRKNNPAFWPIVKVLPEVKYKDLSATIKTPFTLSSLLPKNRNFYRYMGSLTTPNCQENVIWSVMQDIQNIGGQQLQYFLKLYSVEKRYKSRECHITGNYRPLQRLNGRIISGSTHM